MYIIKDILKSLCEIVGFMQLLVLSLYGAVYREEQRLEAAQTKFLRHLLGITKLDKEKNQCIREKNGSTERSKGNKTVPGKVATTRSEEGHKQNTKTSVTI